MDLSKAYDLLIAKLEVYSLGRTSLKEEPKALRFTLFLHLAKFDSPRVL